MNEHMTDYEYILQQARKAHYSNWNDEELRKCVDMLIGLTHEQLFSLYTSKWLNGDKVMREEVFKCMYRDKIGKREERIKNLSTDELIEEFKDKKSGNVSLIRNEMKSRYKENNGDDRIKITMAFKESSTGDQSWVEHQERKEMYVTDKR
jgi:lysine/ornithine N-monooxygenase